MKYIKNWYRKNLKCTRCGTKYSVKYEYGKKPYCNNCIMMMKFKGKYVEVECIQDFMIVKEDVGILIQKGEIYRVSRKQLDDECSELTIHGDNMWFNVLDLEFENHFKEVE